MAKKDHGVGGERGSRAKPVPNPLSKVVLGLFKLLLWAVNVVILIFVLFIRILSRTIRIVMIHIPRLIANVLPKKSSSHLNQQLIYAGVQMTSEEVISITVVYSIVVSAVAFVIAKVIGLDNFMSFVAVVVGFSGVWLLPFVILSLLINKRTEAVEVVLPDVLAMVAQNMAAGMTSYNALWSAARPEFGPLAVEIQDVAKATLTGLPLTDALIGMSNHVNSTKLARSIRLIIQGMKAGGDLPAVLQGISNDMRREFNLKKQMGAETNAHSIFIIFAIMVGAPLLFAVSHQFITIFSTMMDKLQVTDLTTETPEGMITLSQLSISPDFFLFYALMILLISALFGALLVGLLKTGNVLSGVPNIPIFIIGSIAVFFVLKYILSVFFNSIAQF
jgi:hypothetical protein